MSTLGTRSFISFDKPDGLGVRAQVTVNTGVLPVKSVTPKNGIARVEFDHTAAENLSYQVTANVLEDSPFYEVLVNAAGTGEPVSFRLETQRKSSIDRRYAFPPQNDSERAEGVTYLHTKGAKENMVVKKLVSVNNISNHELATDPNDDSAWANVPKTQIPPFLEISSDGSATLAPVAVDVSIPMNQMATAGGFSPALAAVVAGYAVVNGMDPSRVGKFIDKATRMATPNSGVTRGGIREAQPWYSQNFDNEQNLGSYEIGGATAIVKWSETYLAQALTEFGTANPDKNIDPNPSAVGRLEQVKSLAAGLLLIVDSVQTAGYDRDEVRADRLANSHSHARGIVFHVIENVMLETFATAVFSGTRQQWFDQVQALSIERFKAIIETVNSTELLVSSLGVTISTVSVVSRESDDSSPGSTVTVEELTESSHEVTPVSDEVNSRQPTKMENVETLEMPAIREESLTLDDVREEFDVAPTISYLVEDLGPLDKDEMGGIAPRPEDIIAFGKMMTYAEIDTDLANRWIESTFHVESVESIHGPRLNAMINYYRKNLSKEQLVSDLVTTYAA